MFRGVMRGLLLLYSIGLTALLCLTAPWWLRAMRRGGKYREGWRERLGVIPRERLQAPKPGQIVLWVHAVSVGEAIAAARLVRELRAVLPGSAVYVSTTTRTGQAVARERFGAERVFYFPADFAFAVRAWLRFLRPSALVLVESEFWPRVLVETASAGIPVAVVNARVSDRSWPRYQRLARLWKPLLRSTLGPVQAQSTVDAERLRKLGVEWAEVGGNLKYDVEPAAVEPAFVQELRRALPRDVDTVVCGSTLAGEEELLLRELRGEVVTVIAPRHPERFAAVAELVQTSGRKMIRRSEWGGGPVLLEGGSVVVLDSIGELAAVYGVATVAVLGGGFLHEGGHNPLEAAQWGVPVVMGPGFRNFAEIVAHLREANAVDIASPGEIGAAVQTLLSDPEAAQAMGARGLEVCERERGATARAVEVVKRLVAQERES